MKKNQRSKQTANKTRRRAEKRGRKQKGFALAASSSAPQSLAKSPAPALNVAYTSMGVEPADAGSTPNAGQFTVADVKTSGLSIPNDEHDNEDDEYDDADFTDADDELEPVLDPDDYEAELAAYEAEVAAIRIEERQRTVLEEELTDRRQAVLAAVSSLLAGGFSGTAQAVQNETLRVLGGNISIGLVRTVLRELVRSGTAQKGFQGRTTIWQAPNKTGSVLFHFKSQSQTAALFHGMRFHLQKQVRGAVLKRDGNCCRYCGATSDLAAAHLVPVDQLRPLVGLHTAHQPFLMVTLCGEHHRIYDGSMPTPLKEPLSSRNDLLGAAFEEERRLLGNHASRAERKAIADVIEEHRRAIKALRGKADDERRKIRQAIWRSLDVNRECELVGVRWGNPEHGWWDDEHALIELAIRTIPLTSDLMITTKGFSEHWKFAGWTWNRELRVWTAGSGTPPPSTVPLDTYRRLEKHPGIIVERRRVVVAERLLVRWAAFCEDWNKRTAVALAALAKGPIMGSDLSKVCDGNWIRTWLLPLELCTKRKDGTRVVYELTKHGLETSPERSAAWYEILRGPLRESEWVVRTTTEGLPAAPAGLLDLDQEAERQIVGRVGSILAQVSEHAFSWLSGAAIRALLRAHGFAG